MGNSYSQFNASELVKLIECEVRAQMSCCSPQCPPSSNFSCSQVMACVQPSLTILDNRITEIDNRLTQIINEGFSLFTQNTVTLDLLGNGSVADPLKGLVRVSAHPFNSLQVVEDGLYNPLPIENQLVYGGRVTWTGVGYTYDIEASGYYINFQFYESPAVTVTLDPADATFDRLDTFIVNTSNTATFLTGTPSNNPAEPALDTATQLRLSAAFVGANTTEPLADQCIYLENTEWTSLSSDAGRLNPDALSAPCSGLKGIEGSNVLDGDNILFTNPLGAFIIRAYNFIQLNIKSKGTWNSAQLSFQWELGGVPVGSPIIINNGAYGFDETNITDCQTLSIPINDFAGLTFVDQVDSIRITALVPGTFAGFIMDNICISTASVIPGNNNSFSLLYNNGLTRLGNVVQFGGDLLHSTTLETNSFIQTFSGASIYNYPYQFVGRQSFENSTGITSWLKPRGSLDLAAADATNTVRLGINYSSNIYDASPDLNGYFGPNDIGYSFGVNWTGHGSFGVYTDDVNSKTGGIFFHTLDSSSTDLVTIYGKHPTTANGAVGISAGGTGWLNYKIATFHDDKEITFHGYPQTRDDGLSPTSRFLSTDVNGHLKMFSVASSTGISSYLVDGGGIAWVANYDYIVSAAHYVILGQSYSSPETPITLDPADGTFDRIDLVVVDTAGTVQVITGDPSANPQNPSYDPSTQLPLSFILVAASTTQPVCNVLTSVYLENAGTPTEWAAVSNIGAIVVNSGTTPRTGSFDINATGIGVGHKVTFTPSTPFNADDMTQLDLFIRSKATWGATATGKTLAVRFQSSGVDIGVNVLIPPRGAFGFDSTTTGVYQQIVIPKGLFSLPGGASITSMTISVISGTGTMGWLMDDIRIEKNCNTNTGTAITADNGLTMSTPSNVQLGGSLLHNTLIAGGAFGMTITAANAGAALTVSNSSGSGVIASGVNDVGVAGTSTNNVGVGGISTNSFGITASSANNAAALMWITPTSTNTIASIVQIQRQTTGTAADGIGGSFDFYTEAADGTVYNSNKLVSKWTTSAFATRTSQFEIQGVNSAAAASTIMAAHATGVVGIGISSSYTATRLNIIDNTLAANMVVLSSSTSTNFALLQGSASGNTSGAVFTIVDGAGVLGQASGSGTGVGGSSVNGTGVSATSTGGTGLPLLASKSSSTTNAVQEIARVRSLSSGTPANGLGGAISFFTQTATGTSSGTFSNQIISKWTDATDATRTSQFSLTGVNSGTTNTLITVGGDGLTTITTNGSGAHNALIANGLGGGTAITGQGASGGGWFTGTSIGVEGGSGAGIPILGTNFGSGTTSFPIIQIQNSLNTPTVGDEMVIRGQTRITGGTTVAIAGVFGYKMLNVTSGSTASQFIVSTNSGTDLGTLVSFTVNSDGSWDIRPITATQASAITPTEGKMVFVSSTNGTFTSIGFWGYRNGAWAAF